ncbi:LPXTG cell wall anchor domain-containing protein [uncultured Propionibacterium sp.]|uniref:LPXTG cell wall anchor domain-containing protein n=1 Tax=uncultured Propionibacterium sp. TaxID=218066 RepID=UPI00292D3037|nr:LPXTG cell wall anchor domain-containing protein [uncultured Propionibacterium sp.]
MKKLIPPALVCAATALFIPANAYACSNGCGPSDTGASQLDVADHPSTQVDTTAAQKEADRARSFLDAGAVLSQEDSDCFLSKVLQGQYYDQGSRTIRTDSSARVDQSTELEQFSGTSRFQASEFSAWLYEHEDTWWAGGSQDYQVGDVLSFSEQGATRSQGSTEFFAAVRVVAVYVGNGRVVYCSGEGTDTRIHEQSITVLQTELNLSITLVSRPCDKNTTPSQSSSSTPSNSRPDQSTGPSATDSATPSPSPTMSSQAPEEQSPSMAAPSQDSDTATPSESTSAAPSSTSSSASSTRPGSLPKTGGGAALSAVGAAALLAGAGGSILARRRRDRV